VYVLPEDEKGEQANVCAHTLALSLSLSHIDLLRLTCWLASIVSGKNKPGIEKKKERKKNEGMAFSRCDGTEKN
jgi:hypothetical protein